MLDMNQYWPVVLAIGIGTLFLRYSFILIMDKITLPAVFQRMLRFIPASVLPALVVPAVVFHKADVTTYAGWERSVAAVIAVAVAWKTRSILWTIASGMVALWLLQVVF